MSEIIDQEKANLLQAKESLCNNFAAVPDDRLNWSPSPTARTPIEIVVHSAMSLGTLHKMFSGTPFPYKDTASADQFFRTAEKEYRTRDAALALLEANTASYIAWLGALPPDGLEALIETPFGGGKAPVKAMLKYQALHMSSHIPQLEYIQTIYGDRVWHF